MAHFVAVQVLLFRGNPALCNSWSSAILVCQIASWTDWIKSYRRKVADCLLRPVTIFIGSHWIAIRERRVHILTSATKPSASCKTHCHHINLVGCTMYSATHTHYRLPTRWSTYRCSACRWIPEFYCSSEASLVRSFLWYTRWGHHQSTSNTPVPLFLLLFTFLVCCDLFEALDNCYCVFNVFVERVLLFAAEPKKMA